MNRREFLQCAAVLAGGASLSTLSFHLSAEQLQYLASADDYIKKPANIFNVSQRQIIAAIAEVIIPRTDTPGASDANVAQFIELIVQDWFNDQERAIFWQGLKEFEIKIPEKYGRAFDQLDHAQKLQILEAMEEQAADSSWYEKGNPGRAFISDAPFICQLKELSIWGFFTSEVGAKQVLRYNPMPTKFEGSYPRHEGDTSWAPYVFYR